MALSVGARSGHGLFVITVLEFIIGILFLAFIVISVAVLLDPKRVGVLWNDEPSRVQAKKVESGAGQGLAATVIVDNLAEQVSSKVDRHLQERDDRLGRLIIGLGHKMDVANELRETHWSRLHREIDDKLEGILQEAALQVSRSSGIKAVGKGEVEPVQVAEVPSPVVSDAPSTSVNPLAGDKTTLPVVDAAPSISANLPAGDITSVGSGAVVSAEVVSAAPVQIASIAPVTQEVGLEANRSSVAPVLEEGVFNPAPDVAQKKGHFIALGCFSRVDYALDRGRLVRPYVSVVYRKNFQNGTMTCLFSGPLASKSEADDLLQRVQTATHISGLAVGSY